MYAKLFASIYQGTLRGNTHGLVVFTNLLAHADSSGWADIHPRAISEEVGLTLEEVQAALVELESPDPESRSPEEGGRRIVRMNEHRAWGWIIVNYGKYRSIRSEEDRREQNRVAQEKWRNKNKPRKPESAHTEAEAYTEAEAKKKKQSPDVDLFPEISSQVVSDFKAMRSKQKAPITKTVILGISREAEIAGITLEAALVMCCERNWRSFKAEWVSNEKKQTSWQDKKQASDSATWAAINGTDNVKGVTYEASA